MAVQMATRDEYDVRVLYAGPEILTDAERAEFTDALIQLGKDYDGNGEFTTMDLAAVTEDVKGYTLDRLFDEKG